jgi:predicted phosphodiesterase
MKVAVLSDIHANLPALETVVEHIETWGPDQVIVAGDTVNRGPRPAECLNIILEMEKTRGWRSIKGNHEDYVISQSNSIVPEGNPVFEVHKASYWTYQKLNFDVSALAKMPFQYQIGDPTWLNGRVVHASMRGNRDGIYPETTDNELELQIGKPPLLFCVGHTHRPLIRSIGKTLVVNAGSIGLPFDGDRRLSYAQLTYSQGKWDAKIIRLDYDLNAAVSDFTVTGYIENAGPLSKLVLIELIHARSQLYNWTRLYQSQVLAGEITMQASVNDYIKDHGYPSDIFQ